MLCAHQSEHRLKCGKNYCVCFASSSVDGNNWSIFPFNALCTGVLLLSFWCLVILCFLFFLLLLVWWLLLYTSCVPYAFNDVSITY
jgi:hypothetical protein